MNTASNTLASQVPANNDFVATGETVRFSATKYLAVCEVSDDARKWDGVTSEVTHALFSPLLGFWLYCEISVQERTAREWKGSAYGRTARVRYWNQNDAGEWSARDWDSVTVLEG